MRLLVFYHLNNKTSKSILEKHLREMLCFHSPDQFPLFIFSLPPLVIPFIPRTFMCVQAWKQEWHPETRLHQLEVNDAGLVLTEPVTHFDDSC